MAASSQNYIGQLQQVVSTSHVSCRQSAAGRSDSDAHTKLQQECCIGLHQETRRKGKTESYLKLGGVTVPDKSAKFVIFLLSQTAACLNRQLLCNLHALKLLDNCDLDCNANTSTETGAGT